MSRLHAKFGGFAPHFIREYFQEIGIAVLPLWLKPHHVVQFHECRLTDVGESDLDDKKET